MIRYLGLSSAGQSEGRLHAGRPLVCGALRLFPHLQPGALTAAQWFATVSRANPELEQQIDAGEFRSLIEWLRREIHGRGQLLSAEDLLVEVTGERLDARFFKAHLERRYLAD